MISEGAFLVLVLAFTTFLCAIMFQKLAIFTNARERGSLGRTEGLMGKNWTIIYTRYLLLSAIKYYAFQIK